MMTSKRKSFVSGMIVFVLACVQLVQCAPLETGGEGSAEQIAEAVSEEFSLSEVPEYDGEPYAEVNENIPYFSEEELTTTAFEDYSQLDSLGRCGTAYANVGEETMPTEDRESIGEVEPTGWHTVKYNDIVDGNYLYNRCHLIGFQLTGENANTENLITGTRYMNTEGMLPFENIVADYVEETENHVLYRVTPVFEGDDMVASGVLIEAKSVEDEGAGVLFNVFVYNVQPGIEIDYATGDSSVAGTAEDAGGSSQEITYILNTNTEKFHLPDCSGAEEIAEHNRQVTAQSYEELTAKGYSPCKRCQ